MWISLLVFATCKQFSSVKAKYLDLPQKCKNFLSVVDAKWHVSQLKVEMSDIELLCATRADTFPLALTQFETSLKTDLQTVRNWFLRSC